MSDFRNQAIEIVSGAVRVESRDNDQIASVSLSTTGLLVEVRHDDGMLLVNGQEWPDVLTNGANCARAWKDYVYNLRPVNQNDRGFVDVYDAATREPVTSYDVPYATVLHHVEDDGQPITTTDPRYQRRIEVNGVALYDVDTHDGWRIGGGDSALGPCVIVADPQDRLFQYGPFNSPVAARIRVLNGQVYPCLSGINAPDPLTAWTLFTPYQPVTIAPLQLPDSMPAIFIGGTNEKKLVRGSVAWSRAPVPDTRPVMEGTGYRSTVSGRRMFAVEWSTNLESGGLEDVTKRAIPWAKEVGCPVYVHVDNGGSMDELDRYADALMDCAEADVHVIEAAHAVESIPNLERDVAMVSVTNERPSEAWGITVNYRTAGKNLDKFYRCVERAVELARTVPNCKVIWFTGLDSCSDEMRQYVDMLVEMAAIPASLPGQQAPQPPIVTQPPIIPSKPLPLPSQDTTGKGNVIVPNADAPVKKRAKRFRPS